MIFLPNCKEVCEHADDYIDGPTPTLERVKLRLHLLMCKHCRRFLRHMRLVMGVAPTLAEEQTPSDADIDRLIRKLHPGG